ncbi:sugar-transfer associated ATP-grasp domain-containing protein [Rhodohalobacter barkolensis]|uniref:ATP-grasp domain-containing protein n=1 Tax=Rhodohalobacter barkolensis TaxID=2053187 RepID=A0A2N0VGG8_9BACT|nr:sugar-transfer associated ATP-grasp domain-containing protein [Rhodohalobacter barkolensis]PKD43260.1 hypothetical protein CWD77_11640 [Rhodohalobacter barkolensis]
MIKRILSGNMSLKEHVKSAFNYSTRSRGAKKAWKKRHGIVFDKHPEYREEATKVKEKAHREYWSDFQSTFRPDTLRICEAISGDADPKIIPEEIFQADIEPSLNRIPEAHYLGNKSLYNRWFSEGIFPKDYLHNIDGELLDTNYNSVKPENLKELAEQFHYPAILKPNMDSWGGNAIHFVENSEELLTKIKEKKNFVVQERITQNEIQSRLHPPSLNTVRVYLYKSVIDNKTHIVNIAQRMGNGGALDNVASGGLISLVRENGRLHGYALDRYGQKFKTHPVTGLAFDQALPEFKKLKNLALEVGSKMFQLRVVGLDLCYDSSGSWRIIEINTKGHSIRFSQYPGQPFFGEFMDEVKQYCIERHWSRK